MLMQQFLKGKAAQSLIDLIFSALTMFFDDLLIALALMKWGCQLFQMGYFSLIVNHLMSKLQKAFLLSYALWHYLLVLYLKYWKMILLDSGMVNKEEVQHWLKLESGILHLQVQSFEIDLRLVPAQSTASFRSYCKRRVKMSVDKGRKNAPHVHL